MRYLLLLLPMLMMGCADSSTTGTNREYDIRVDISQNTGPVSLAFPLNVDATSSTDQTTEGEASIAPDVNLQLVQPGATGSLSGADSTIKDTISKFQNILRRDAEKEAVEQLPVVTPPVVVPVPAEPTIPEDIPPSEGGLTYETYFLNTQTASPEGGKVLALCPGDTRRFDKCTADGVNLPFHRLYNGGSLYWNMNEAPKGDIVCVLDGKQYLYPATNNDHRGRVTGSCKKPTEVSPITSDLTREDGKYHGRPNGDRPQWYFTKDLKDYPKTIILDIPGCFDSKVINHDGIRYDVDSLVLKQSDVAGRHMAILAPQSCKSEIATITY